ncbi:glycosyltransferase family 4 protein [Spongisporangium articulatum]|uniref:Glycosyltransferase family 4 protein n=1 Tax=Spongisporangium articulatum TaxID=3362603 RepID=A0ABW8ANA1_9ACTN
MTVYVNGRFLEHPITGTQRYALEITRRLLETERDVVLLLPSGTPVPAGVDPARCRTLPLRGMAFEQVTLPLVTAGRMLLSLGGPAPVLKRKQLVVMHDATPFRWPGTFSKGFVAWYRLMYGVLTRTARHLVTVSRFSATELGDVFGIPARRFHVVPCAVDHLQAYGAGERPANLPAAVTRYALMLGTLARHKNVVPVAKAVAEAGTDLVIVGKLGGDRVFSDPGDLGLPANAHLVGRLTDAEIVWLYRNATVFVFPSYYEGFGIPAIEAQLEGCPVVASSAASIPEVLAGSADLFDPDDPAAAAQLVKAVVSEDDEARLVRVAAGLRNAARFSWADSAREIMTVVRRGRAR